MREIKFRAWNEPLGKMFSDGWHTYCKGENSFNTINDHIRYLDGLGIKLMQYTGLKDSEDQEIYEGDIVDFTYWWFDGNEAESHLTGEVIYLPESMSFGLRGVKNADWIRHIGGAEGSSDTAPFATWRFSEDDFQIIGNIWEEPELLEAKS